MYRELLKILRDNGINLGYVLNDIWFSPADNMLYVKHYIKSNFVMAIKAIGKVAQSQEE